MKKKVLIFDLDGVICDSPKLVNEFFLYTYPTMTQDAMNEILAGNFHEELEKFKLIHEPRVETPGEKEARRIAYTKKKTTVPLYKGMYELLQSLHTQGNILTINTSALEKNCIALLKYAQVFDFFDFVATAEVSKSKIEKFQIMKDKYKVSAQEMLFVTDTLGDIREADISQVPTIGVTWGAHSKSFLEREYHANVVAIVDTMEGLKGELRVRLA